MADFSALISKLVGVANTITVSLQAAVSHEAWDGTYTDSGEPNYDAAVSRLGVVEGKQTKRIARDGTEKVTRTRLTFVGAIAVDPLDRITLPDGTQPEIIAIVQPISSSGTPFITEVWF